MQLEALLGFSTVHAPHVQMLLEDGAAAAALPPPFTYWHTWQVVALRGFSTVHFGQFQAPLVRTVPWSTTSPLPLPLYLDVNWFPWNILFAPEGADERLEAGLVAFPLGSIHVVVCVLWLIKKGFPDAGSVLISHPAGSAACIGGAWDDAGRSHDVSFVL